MTPSNAPTRVLSRRMIAVGLLCIAGISGLLVETLADWTYTTELMRAAEATSEPGGIHFTHVISCPGLLGWLGGWAYMAAWLWLPAAVWQMVRARRDDRTLHPFEGLLLAAVAVLMVAAPCALWFAAFRYR